MAASARGRASLARNHRLLRARDFVVDNGPHWSAAIAFNSILSLFPLALAGVSIAAWFIDPQWAIERADEVLGEVMPRVDTIRDIVSKAVAARGQTGVLSFVLLLWAGSRVFAVLIRALNIAFDVDDTYGFLRRLLVELGMLLSVGLLFLGALVSDLMAPVLGSIPEGKSTAFAVIGSVVPALLLAGGFFCLYKFVPRHRCNWQSALLGAVAATVLTLGARPLFLAYVGKLASYSQIYGWLAIGIVLLVWAEIVAIITLYCGELASHIQMMAYDGLNGEEVARRHRVRSPGRSGAGDRRTSFACAAFPRRLRVQARRDRRTLEGIHLQGAGPLREGARESGQRSRRESTVEIRSALR